MKDKKNEKEELKDETITEETEQPETKKSAEANSAENEKSSNDKIAELEKQLSEEKDKYLRMAAEYDNFRRRSAKEREDVYADAYADALKEILPVVDNLERATGFMDTGTTPDAKQLSEGVRLIVNQFTETLKKLGIEPFGVPGETFDPQIHNAIMHEENADKGEGEIVEVFQRGYKRGDKIIRFAMVKVAN